MYTYRYSIMFVILVLKLVFNCYKMNRMSRHFNTLHLEYNYRSRSEKEEQQEKDRTTQRVETI